jgi:hypothetical protein
VGAYDPATGHVGVKVLDRDANPVFNAPVTIPGRGTEMTNTQGCAFFGFLPAGSYSVSLGSVGWVDRQLNVTPSQVVGVTAGDVKQIQFDYDRETTYAVTFASELGYAAPSDLPVTVYTPQLVPNGMKVLPGTGSPRTIAGLFPFLEGFQLWAGMCSDSDPAYWPGGDRGSALDAVAGATTATNISLKDVEITVVDALGLPVTGAVVRAEHGDGSGTIDPLCASGDTHVIGTTNLLPPGRVDTALPYGTWTLKVAGRTPVGAWPTVTLDPTASGVVTTEVKVL